MSNQKGRLTGRVLKFGARLFTIRTMVRVVAYGLVALAACLLLCANVYAQRQLSKAATAGRDTFLEGYSAADNNCQVLDPPEIIIDQPPEHGFVCLRRGDSLLKTTMENNLAHCLGKQVSGVHVIYVSHPDYSGADHVRYTVRFWTVRHSVDVTLKVLPAWGAGRH